MLAGASWAARFFLGVHEEEPMSVSGPTDQPAEPSPPKGCLTRGAGVMGSICLLIVLATVAAFVFFPREEQSESEPGILSEAGAHPAVGQKLPQLELQHLTAPGESVTLDDLAGKVVLVNLWGPWCKASKTETPKIAELGRQYVDRPDFQLLAVSCGVEFPEDLESLRKDTETFVRWKKLHDLPVYTDPASTTRKAFYSLGGSSHFPTVFLMDQGGVIRRVWVGYKPGQGIEEDMQEWVARLLDEKK
jgi:thiol-disulfide isomerase/thioredoxin